MVPVDILRTEVLAQLPFRDASLAWLESRKPYLGERTFIGYKNQIDILNAFFGEMRLTEIGPDEIRADGAGPLNTRIPILSFYGDVHTLAVCGKMKRSSIEANTWSQH